jgi:hypothetical protein
VKGNDNLLKVPDALLADELAAIVQRPSCEKGPGGQS